MEELRTRLCSFMSGNTYIKQIFVTVKKTKRRWIAERGEGVRANEDGRT
jgi:hypothetical protein